MTAVGLLPPVRSLSWSVTPPGTPGPESVVEVVSGTRRLVAFRWGRPDGFGTAAYWTAQVAAGGHPAASSVGTSLAEEVCFCLLGGYGVTAEMNHAAYRAVSEAGLIRTEHIPDPAEIETNLRAPLAVRGHRRPIHYRFPSQRAQRLSVALALLGSRSLPSTPVELRDALLEFPGIGHKTASWIVRNHTGSDDIAIIDVHLRRAGLAAGFFRPEWRLPQDYAIFEAAFLAYAGAGNVSAASLDLCIWDQVRRLGHAADKILRPMSRVG